MPEWRARSGRALREGLAVANAPGTIDSDYRGEVKVLVVNLGRESLVIRRGERIAQLVVAPVARCELVEAGELDATARGDHMRYDGWPKGALIQQKVQR